VAKKKSRVPTPPRPVQAPKKRSEPHDPKRTRIWLLALAAAIVVAGGAVGIAMALGGGGGGSAADEGVTGPCKRETFPPMGRQHVQQLSEGFRYSSFPATSGPHDGVPAIWNVYDRPVPQVKLVHNLEHGGVIVQYGSSVSQQTVQEIVSWYQDDPLGIIVAPLPPPDEVRASAPPNATSEIFLTAWTHLMTCTTFDEDAFSDFRDDYRGPGGDAPEEFPLEALQPGST
jgi:hypothetical protein